MARIVDYNRTVFTQLSTPQFAPEANPWQAAAQAGQNIFGEYQKIQKEQEAADNTTTLNLASIENKRKKLEFFDQAQQDFKDNPDGFQKHVEEGFKTIDQDMINNLPDKVKPYFNVSAQQSSLGFLDNTITWEYNQKVLQQAGRVEESAKNLTTMAYRYGQDGKGLDDLYGEVEATAETTKTFLSPEKSAESRRTMYQNVTEDYLKGLAKNNPEGARKALDSRQFDEHLTPDSIARIDSSINTSLSNILAAGEEQRRNVISDFDLKIATTEDVDTLNDIMTEVKQSEGTIGHVAMNQRLESIDKKIKSKQDDIDVTSYVYNSITDGKPVDLSDSKVSKVVDKMYLNTMEKADQSLQPNDLKAQFVSMIGSVPEVMKREISTNLRSNNVSDVVSSVALIQKVKVDKPEAVKDFKEEDLRYSNLIQTNIETGYPENEAVSRAKERLTVSSQDEKTRRDNFQKVFKEDEAMKALGNEVNSFWRNDPNKLPQQMVDEFRSNVRNEYIMTGDMETAQKTAVDVLKKNWTPSRTTGDLIWMKDAPEKYYSLAGMSEKDNSKWMHEDLMSSLSERDIDTDELVLSRDKKSDPNHPLYNVLYRKDGILYPTIDNSGNVLKWFPDKKKYVNKFKAENRQALFNIF